jgi:DNA modification methylase
MRNSTQKTSDAYKTAQDPTVLPGINRLEICRSASNQTLAANNIYRQKLLKRYAKFLIKNFDITRSLVSFQSNKNIPFYRWYRYKEAFSHQFSKFIFDIFNPAKKKRFRVLDPFAGAGTTLTTAVNEGYYATGIELLPVANAIIKARVLAEKVNISLFTKEVDKINETSFSKSPNGKYHFPHVRITENSFGPKTEHAISSYADFISNIKNEEVKYLLWFACLSILEDISYTRKDGQYLRWDYRSPRNLKSNFNKGEISDFDTAIHKRLHMMSEDINQRNGNLHKDRLNIYEGSCLEILPLLPKNSFDIVLTSPPYCNRYDYTRTYALELAFMNHNESSFRSLRQTLISATVENKTKQKLLKELYKSRKQLQFFDNVFQAFKKQNALKEILGILYRARVENILNNPNIPTMVENYFFEMNLVIHELSRIIAPGGHIVMVNDNVQYLGEEIPVDLILSDFAVSAGMDIESIWVLPRGKGNSSQQMGVHGRNELRKCVYVWSKKAE